MDATSTETTLLPTAHRYRRSARDVSDNAGLSKPLLTVNRPVELMSKARSQASFDTETLTHFIHGGKANTDRRRAAFKRVEAVLGIDDTMKLPPGHASTDRETQYLLGLKFGQAMLDDETQHGHGAFDIQTHQYALAISSPYGHNTIMFGPTVELQGTAEQKARWMPLIKSGKIIGTYVQTELGHGTFVRGLETTATFDRTTDEFVIHSPTVSSTKYWPSALGFSASYAVVMARLVIDEKDHGVHPFLVQIRSLEDYKNMPGVETGDIGSKAGFNTTDMGYAIFNKVRIPRDQMLMGHAQVDRDGKYTPPPHAKLAYSTLLCTRVNIIFGCAFQLAQAAVIATRFSVAREQGMGVATGVTQEVPIITYKAQQYRLFTVMAQAYGLLFASKMCKQAYSALQNEQAKNNHQRLPQVHFLSAALKAYATQVAFDGAEDARKCCGGFGFSDMSGFTALMGSLSPLPVLEGENYVLYQQAARYLMKAVTSVRQGKPVDASLNYLTRPTESRCSFQKIDEFRCEQNQITLFQHRAARLILEAADLLNKAQTENKLSYPDAWNKNMLSLVRAARAHIELFVLQCFTVAVQTSTDSATRHVLTTLRDLFALTAVENPLLPGAMAFFEDGYVDAKQLAVIRQAVDELLVLVHPEIIALGDAWDFTDASLGSAIGMRDGNMYERLMAWTKQLPLNIQAKKDGSVHQKGYRGFVEPMLRSRL